MGGRARRALLTYDPKFMRSAKILELGKLAAIRERQAASRNKKAVTFNLDKSTSSKKTDFSPMAGRTTEALDPAMMSSSSSENEIETPVLLARQSQGNLYLKMKKTLELRKRANRASSGSQEKQLQSSGSASAQPLQRYQTRS